MSLRLSREGAPPKSTQAECLGGSFRRGRSIAFGVTRSAMPMGAPDSAGHMRWATFLIGMSRGSTGRGFQHAQGCGACLC
jgi:hypothetical protein